MSPARLSTIGPYRLEDRLGVGGMGEVWRAWDERLHRSVAVKLIRPESAEDLTARERFRREARAAAALVHPSIVRIYDIIDSDERDAIVMELVEGELLSQRIARGPLPVEEVIRLGRQIVEGLAAAHRRDILHRDLKAENVIVTSEGEAKVLDFGLAQRLSGDTEENLTRTGNIAGTFRTMSPEQARNLPLDPRSDLFSFGVLLYEMLSCHSPFKGEAVLETLQGICSKRQVPVQDLRSEVPSALSHLIDDLLEKEASFRPPSAQVVGTRLEAIREELRETSADKETWVAFGALAQGAVPAVSDNVPASRFIGWRISTAIFLGVLLLLAVFVLALPRFRHPPLVYVAFLTPEVTLGKDIPGIDLMVSSLSLSLESGLWAIEGVSPWTIEQRDQSSSSLQEVARATAASEIFTSQLSCGTNICQVSIHRLRAPDGTLLWTKTFSVPLERPYLLAETLQDALEGSYPDRLPRDGEPWLQAREADYSEYLRLHKSLRDRDISLEEILDRLARIQRSSPRFLEAKFLESRVLKKKFRTGRDLRDLQRAYEILEQARKLAPHDPSPLFEIFDVALFGNDLERAADALAALERIQPSDDARLLANRASLLNEQQGNSKQALALMRRATERLPSSRNLYLMARMEYENGEMMEARATLQEFLRRSPKDNHSEYFLAQLEMFGGDPRKAAEIFERLLQDGQSLVLFSDLGMAELLLGNLHQAEQSFRRARRGGHSSELLSLAETLFLRGDREEADDLYGKTLRLAEEESTAGTNWYTSSVRAQALAHLGRNEEAVAAIQEALQLAPNRPEVVYAASKVYALLGDEASALFNAKRALAQGRAPRWFNFPWFDPLRPALELEAPVSDR